MVDHHFLMKNKHLEGIPHFQTHPHEFFLTMFGPPLTKSNHVLPMDLQPKGFTASLASDSLTTETPPF